MLALLHLSQESVLIRPTVDDKLLSTTLFNDIHQGKDQPGLLTSIPFVVSKGESSKHGEAWGGGFLPNAVSWVLRSSL